jgi:hypothetical protein
MNKRFMYVLALFGCRNNGRSFLQGTFGGAFVADRHSVLPEAFEETQLGRFFCFGAFLSHTVSNDEQGEKEKSDFGKTFHLIGYKFIVLKVPGLREH